MEISAPYDAFLWGVGGEESLIGTFIRDPDPIADVIGVLRLARDTTFSFEALGKDVACIKNLDIVLCYDPPSERGERLSYKMYHGIVVSLRTPSTLGGEARVSVSLEMHSERNTTYERIYTDDIEKLATPTIALLTGKVAQAGFKGLAVSGLQELAKTVLNVHLTRADLNRTGPWDTGQYRRDRAPEESGQAQYFQKEE